MDKKRTGMTYEDWCENLYVVELKDGHLWCEDLDGAYHYDGRDGEYYLDERHKRDFVECSDRVLNYLDRLYDTRLDIDD